MSEISEQNSDHVVLNIDQEELTSMEEKLREEPKLLNKSAGNKKCCIFRAPLSLVEINLKAYRPQIVSIGPYHRRSENKDLEMFQQHKGRFLGEFLARSPGKDLKFYLNLMLSMDSEIRQSYSESIDQFSKNELAQIMVLDGSFIIELFRKAGKVTKFHKDDPFCTMSWVSPSLMRDLLRLENQIPFKVLQRLFDESKDTCTSSTPEETFAMLTLKFFNHAVQRPEKELKSYENLEGKHLLDFFRKSFINDNQRGKMRAPDGPPLQHAVHRPQDELQKYENLKGKHLLDFFRKSFIIKKNKPKDQKPASDDPFLKLIPPATKLQVAGVKFKENQNTSRFLDIKFDKGLLEIPRINMDDIFSSFLLNCVAFEQCYFDPSKDYTTYIIFMSCLINTPADASLLSDKKIIENYFGTDKEVSEFFHKVGKDVAFYIKDNYLAPVFKDVNEYYSNGWHVWWAGFMHTYFESPWSFISALAACILISLTVLQSFYTVFPYYHPRNSS